MDPEAIRDTPMIMSVSTGWYDGTEVLRLAEGDEVLVDEATAARWEFRGLAHRKGAGRGKNVRERAAQLRNPDAGETDEEAEQRTARLRGAARE